MELSFLYAIPRSAVLDSFFLLLTKIAGSHGELCLVTGILLTIFKKTRRTGIAILITYLGVLLCGQLVLKNLIDRPRPCHIDQAFALLVDRPASSSFPSTHSAWAFGAATAIFQKYRKAGIVAFVVAACIAFSRMYLFLHFPTDVLCGIALGVVLGIVAAKISSRFLH